MTSKEIINYIEESFMSHYFVDLHLSNNDVIGFYKTQSLKYIDKNNQEISYLFPVHFSFHNSLLITRMTFGFVERGFTLPKLKEDCAYVDGLVFRTEPSEDLIYNRLVAIQTHNIKEKNRHHEYINIKSFMCSILGLSQIGFPFMKIINQNTLKK